jgi:hypothetical protein
MVHNVDTVMHYIHALHTCMRTGRMKMELVPVFVVYSLPRIHLLVHLANCRKQNLTWPPTQARQAVSG